MTISKEYIIEYFKSGIKEKKDFRIGIEHEKFLFGSKNNKRIDYSKVKEMFSALNEFGWNPIKEGENVIGLNKEGKNIAPTGANRLGEFYTSEGIAATKHANGVDIWITVIELNSTNLRSYLLTSDGLDTNAVVSDVAPNLFGDAGRGGMAFSPDGSKLAVGTGLPWPQNSSRLIVYEFDNSTGNFSERRRPNADRQF